MTTGLSTPLAKRSFFSIRYDLITTETPLLYDLFVNSSALEGREKFVRVFPAQETLSTKDLEALKLKYMQLYVPEDQRNLYMKSLVKSDIFDDTQKATVLKSSALEYLGRIFDKEREFSTELLEQNIEGCREVVGNMVDLLGEYGIDDLRGLIGNLSFHDFYTFDHSINVSMYCITIWKAYKPNAPREALVNIGLGGLLHDLGKVKVPTEILNSTGKLTDEEYNVIKQHPDFGLELLVSGQVKVHPTLDVKVIGRIIHEHHENWDGTGYPNKKKSEDIHPMARACTIADFFDAVTTKRSYNEVLPIQDAVNVLKKFREKKLDPVLFDVFEKSIAFVRSDYNKNLMLADYFDPTLSWKELPVEELKFETKKEFGKIRVVDPIQKKKSS
jgi:HD-GYP domain-containing protein (c-di-GMP phosphodiesterase class II)